MDTSSSESLSDIANEIETLCNLMKVYFNIYDLRGSLQRIEDKLIKYKMGSK